jgi:hypothetical protein
LGWHEDENGISPEGIPILKRAEPMDERTNFFVGWGTLALINAGLAQGKGRSGLVWCLLSLLLGPIATFLIVVLDKVRLDGE